MNWINLIVSVMLTSISIIIAIANISEKRLNIILFAKFFIVSFSTLLLACSFLDGITRLIFNILIIIISLYFSIFNKSIEKSVYYALVYELYAFIAEILLSIVFVSILRFNLNSYEEFSFSLMIFSIFNCLIVYFLTKINKLNKIVTKIENTISKNNKDWIYSIIIVTLLILLLTFNRYNLSNNLLFYINIGMVIFVFLTLIYVICNKFQRDALEDKYNQMMDYVSKYEKIINEQGKKNHEYNNQLMVLKGYVNKPDKLEEYLNLLISEHKCGQNYTVKQLGYFPDGGIKGLIYHKLSKMEENEVKPYLYIDQNIKNVFEEKFDINTYRDITKLLGVFLDNAIEAAKEGEPKEVELEIKNKDKYILITISNTFSRNIDVSQVGKKGFSTKGAGHGFGLSIVKDIAKNNSNIETFNDIYNNKFKQTIMIYYKK